MASGRLSVTGLEPEKTSINSHPVTIRRKLLAWYDREHRDLPWRKTKDPYRIWVSEVMLQQTRAQAVIPYYEEFLRVFPNVRALAGASERKLLGCWSGLGYYSRARNLKAAARVIVSRYNGQFPREREEALALPGIGTYTAAAVLSIAYGVPLAVLDGNVARVLSRLLALRADVRSTGGKAKLLREAERLLSRRRPGDFNQALMELGATVCLPRQPQCPLCPLRASCRALAGNVVANYPARRRKAKPVLRRFRAFVVLDGKGKCLLVRRHREAQWMGGFWELPMEEVTDEAPSEAPLNEPGIAPGTLLGVVRHTITSNRLEVSVFRTTLEHPPAGAMAKWVLLDGASRWPLTTITRKALTLL